MRVLIAVFIIALSTTTIQPTQVPEPTRLAENGQSNILSIEDFDLIATVVEAETGNQPDIARQKVAEVILNRMAQGYTAEQVIFAPRAFACTPKLNTTYPSERSIQAVKVAMNNVEKIDSLYFCDDSIIDTFPSYFSQPMEIVSRHGDMVFWRVKK